MTWDFQLPKLSATGDAATVIRWLKRPGDWVEAGEVLLEIETDKATMEVEAPQAGLLAEILVQAGETAEAGAVIARFTDERPQQETVGTSALAARPLSPMRRRIAEEVTKSLREIPAFWVERWVNVEALEQVRARLNAPSRRGSRSELTFTDFLLQAVADVLSGHLSLSSRLTGASPEEWAAHRLDSVNVGLVVSLPEGGLLVPVLRNLQGRDLFDIAAQRRALVEAARAGRLEAPAVADAALSISNVGATGADRFRAIIYPGQTAILAVGRIHERVVPSNGQVTIQRGCYLNLTVDHRMVDGVDASRFIGTLAGRIERGPWRPMPDA